MTALLLDPIFKQHLTGHGHPERPERYDAVTQALELARLPAKMKRVTARAATEDEIAACHTREYIESVKRDVAKLSKAHPMTDLSTGDTVISERSLEIARLAAGGVMQAVDAVMRGEAKNAFCAVRPPGHHATPTRGMGFCLFNNVALAARYAQKKHGVERVVIADWDVHHGNGTQDIFYTDGTVFFFSTHQSPWYPGTGAADETGEGKGKGTTMNCPFPAGSGRKEIFGAFRDRLAPAMDQFKPDLVILSAGFDSRVGDPLGRFLLTDREFAELTEVMLEIGVKHAKGRLVSVLEGGYNLSGLASAVMTHAGTLEKA